MFIFTIEQDICVTQSNVFLKSHSIESYQLVYVYQQPILLCAYVLGIVTNVQLLKQASATIRSLIKDINIKNAKYIINLFEILLLPILMLSVQICSNKHKFVVHINKYS
jgi:hypothetical protein